MIANNSDTTYSDGCMTIYKIPVITGTGTPGYDSWVRNGNTYSEITLSSKDFPYFNSHIPSYIKLREYLDKQQEPPEPIKNWIRPVYTKELYSCLNNRPLIPWRKAQCRDNQGCKNYQSRREKC